MKEIQNPPKKTIAHAAQAPALRVEPVWNLEFDTCPLVPFVAGGLICNLVLGSCGFRQKTPRQSHLSLTHSKGLYLVCVSFFFNVLH
jgi:hypothetical protein